MSYNSKDNEQKNSLKKVLRDNGIPVVDYVEEMHPGEAIAEFIRRSINENNFTINLISRNSLLSAWVAEEALLSLNYQEVRGQGYVPCLLDATIFDANFVDEARQELSNDLAKIRQSMIKRLEQKLPISDIYERFTLLTQLRNNLENLIGKLRSIGCRDLTKPGEAQKLAEDLLKMARNK